MARKKPGSNSADFVLFNVIYDDGSLSSNRKVPSDIVESLDGEDAIRAALEAQDRRIAELSGRPSATIKSFTRVGARR
ncbi:MAG: hypothetical protein AB7K86_17700 [Rhodospirillales bacterium]